MHASSSSSSRPGLFSILLLVWWAATLASQTCAAGRAPEYFVVRPDGRECAFPKCGGFFLRPVNAAADFECPTTVGASRKGECYVAEIQGATVSPSLALVRGRFVSTGDDLYAFEASESYDGTVVPHPIKNKDVFFSVSDVGVNCIAAPCNTFHAVRLNEVSFARHVLMFAALDFDELKASEASTRTALQYGDVIFSAKSYAVSGPAGTSQALLISNIFTKQVEPTRTCRINRDCDKSEVCARDSCESKSGTCQVRPSSCSKISSPVCACDGVREYANDCMRLLFGVSAKTSGSCATPAQ